MKFAASYSGGKDSILAITRGISQGLEPVLLITTYNTDRERSWFHGIPDSVLERVSDCIDIPILLVRTSGEEYTANFEKALLEAKEMGAECCVFGDIDIADHLEWCTKCCENVGLKAVFPLWNEGREKLVYEFIDRGFTANFTVIDTSRLGDDLLGKSLSHETAAHVKAQGADVCGEHGEYHTFVSDGPIFKSPVDFTFGEKIIDNGYAILPILDK